MLKQTICPIAVATLLLGLSWNPLHAQTSFGSRSFGSGVGNLSTGGSSNFGQGYNTGGSGLGGSGYGTGGTSSGQQLPTSYGNGSTTNTSGQVGNAGGLNTSAGQVQGNARYLAQNRQGAFVGADRGDTTAFGSQQAGAAQNTALRSQTAFFNQISQQMQRNEQMLNQQNRQGGNQRQQLRTTISLGFAPKTAMVHHTTVATTKLQTRLTKLPNLDLPVPVKVELVGGEVVLRGTVATQSDRELVEGIAMMEPGIDSVRNELVVDPAASRVGQ